MSTRKQKMKLEDLPEIAKMEFEPVEGFQDYQGATHAEWTSTSESMRWAMMIAAGVCAKDKAGVQTMVREVMSDGDLAVLGAMLDKLQDGIKMCKAVAKVLEAAEARLLIASADVA